MKKKWLVIGAVLLVLIVVAAFMLGRSSSQEKTPTSEKLAVGGVIKLPNGSKVEVVFNGPPELEITWKRLEVSDYEFRTAGIIKNGATETVQLELVFILDGVQRGKWPPLGNRTLNPGEQTEFAIGIMGDEKSKLLEVKVVGFSKTGGSPTTPIQTRAPQPSPKQTPTPQPSLTPTAPTLTYKTNPVMPAEVLMTFLGLANEKRYKEAEEFLILNGVGPLPPQKRDIFGVRGSKRL